MVLPVNVLALDSKDLAAHARIYAPAAIAVAVEIMGNPKAKDGARLKACALVLAYGHGTPVQNLKLSGGFKDDSEQESHDPDAAFREQLRSMAENTARGLGNHYTEIAAPDPARDQVAPQSSATGKEPERESLQGEILAPIRPDDTGLSAKGNLAAAAVGLVIAGAFERG